VAAIVKILSALGTAEEGTSATGIASLGQHNLSLLAGGVFALVGYQTDWAHVYQGVSWIVRIQMTKLKSVAESRKEAPVFRCDGDTKYSDGRSDGATFKGRCSKSDSMISIGVEKLNASLATATPSVESMLKVVLSELEVGGGFLPGARNNAWKPLAHYSLALTLPLLEELTCPSPAVFPPSSVIFLLGRAGLAGIMQAISRTERLRLKERSLNVLLVFVPPKAVSVWSSQCAASNRKCRLWWLAGINWSDHQVIKRATFWQTGIIVFACADFASAPMQRGQFKGMVQDALETIKDRWKVERLLIEFG
jgi:hypothetical protein